MVADALLQEEPRSGIDDVFLARPAGAELDRGQADQLRVERGEDAAAISARLAHQLRLRQPRGIVDHRGIAALGFDQLRESFERCAVRQRGLQPHPRQQRIDAHARRLAGDEHLDAEPQRQLAHVLRAGAAEDVDRLAHFDRVADRAAERRVHVGEERDAAAPQRFAQIDHGASERARFLDRFHEGAAADLDVEHQRVDPCG